MLGAADNKDWLWITDRHDYVLWLGGTAQPKIKKYIFFPLPVSGFRLSIHSGWSCRVWEILSIEGLPSLE